MVRSTNQPSAIPSGLASLWQGLMRNLFSDYRPERHYMRGPGPAWRAKHVRA